VYILKEAIGMINFFHHINQPKDKEHAIKVLEELTENKGIIADLLH
jgi:hypothetical protein